MALKEKVQKDKQRSTRTQTSLLKYICFYQFTNIHETLPDRTPG